MTPRDDFRAPVAKRSSREGLHRGWLVADGTSTGNRNGIPAPISLAVSQPLPRRFV
jgi:hypothetical protein